MCAQSHVDGKFYCVGEWRLEVGSADRQGTLLVLFFNVKKTYHTTWKTNYNLRRATRIEHCHDLGHQRIRHLGAPNFVIGHCGCGFCGFCSTGEVGDRGGERCSAHVRAARVRCALDGTQGTRPPMVRVPLLELVEVHLSNYRTRQNSLERTPQLTFYTPIPCHPHGLWPTLATLADTDDVPTDERINVTFDSGTCRRCFSSTFPPWSMPRGTFAQTLPRGAYGRRFCQVRAPPWPLRRPPPPTPNCPRASLPTSLKVPSSPHSPGPPLIKRTNTPTPTPVPQPCPITLTHNPASILT